MPADFPLVEKRAPIGLAVLTVLLVVGAGYAVWHYLPRQQTVVREKVPPVPDRLLASRPAPAAPTDAATPAAGRAGDSGANAAAPAPTASAVRSAPPVAACRSLAGAARQRGAADRGRSQAAPLAPPVVVAVPAPPPPPSVDAVPAPPPPPVMPTPAIGQAQAAQPPAPSNSRASRRRRSRRGSRGAHPGAAAAAANLPVKVDTPVRARTNSWVELRAPDGDVLAQTYVRAGESYVVPAGIAYRIIDAR